MTDERWKATPFPDGTLRMTKRGYRSALTGRLRSTSKRCIVHDLTYTTVCAGCRADQIAAEETA